MASSSTNALAEGDVLVDNEGRRWPRITRENSAEHKYPNLRNYNSAKRGPGSPPWCWFVQMSGKPEWDQDGGSKSEWRKMKDRWDGWNGDNEKRVEQRRNSEQQRAADAASHARSDAAEAQAAQARLYTLSREQQPQTAFFDARAADMAASLLAAIGADGLVDSCSMDLGTCAALAPRCQIAQLSMMSHRMACHGRC